MTDLLALTAAIAFAAIAATRFAWACNDTTFLASTRQASKAAFGLAAALALFAVALIGLPDARVEALLVPLGVVGLAGLLLAPPTPRRTFVAGVAATAAALGAALVHVVVGHALVGAVLISLPVALAVGHLPLPGRPSVRFLAAIPVLAGVAAVLPSPLLLAPGALLFFAAPAQPAYAILPDEAPWDQRMMYYLGLVGALLAAMVALWAGAGGPLQDPRLDDAQLAVGLIAAALILVPIIKAGFGLLRRSGLVGPGAEAGGSGSE